MKTRFWTLSRPLHFDDFPLGITGGCGDPAEEAPLSSSRISSAPRTRLMNGLAGSRAPGGKPDGCLSGSPGPHRAGCSPPALEVWLFPSAPSHRPRSSPGSRVSSRSSFSAVTWLAFPKESLRSISPSRRVRAAEPKGQASGDTRGEAPAGMPRVILAPP